MKHLRTLCVFLTTAFIGTAVCFGETKPQASPETDPSTANAQTETFSSRDIQEDDAIYFKVEEFDVSANPALCPYFEVYSHEGNEKDRVAQTRASERFLSVKSVSDPDDYEISIPKTEGATLSIDVLTDYGNEVLAEGRTFPADVLLKQTDPQAVQKLEISPGNTVSLRFVREKKRKKIFQIIGFDIQNISKSANEKLVDKSQMEFQVKCNEKPLQEHRMPNGRLDNTDIQSEDFLLKLEFTDKLCIEFQNSWGKAASFQIPDDELIRKLKETIDQHPGDPSSWKMKFQDAVGNSCVLKFQGVQHLYRVKSIRIPEGAPVRSEARPILSTKDPNFRIYVMEDGAPCGVNSEYARSSAPRSWQNDFAPDEKNLFLVKAGCAHIYSIFVEDTSPLLDSPMVLEFVDLRAESFRSEIRQKLPSMMSEERASRIVFEEVKEKK